MIRKKVLLLGDFSVGKTSLIRRYIDNTFDDSYLTTIGVKISKKMVYIDNIEYELLIWDVEGATPCKKIPISYYQGASGAIFVADMGRSDTIKNLDDHIRQFHIINPNGKYVIAYNKSDLLSDEQKKVFQLGKETFFTSAKNNTNIDELFTTLAKDIFS